VRHNAGGRDVLAFDQWLQHGIYHARTELRAEWETSYSHSPAYRFVFFPENSESLLLGVLQPSHDRSDRSYPFIVCLRIDRRLSANRLPLIPMLFSSFLDDASQLVEDATRESMTLQQLAERTEALCAPVECDYASMSRAYETSLGATSVGRLRELLWGGDGNERTQLVFKNLIEVLVPLRGRNAARLALGLRFPLPVERSSQRFTASFWLLAASALVGANWPRPFFFWTAPSSPAASSSNGANGSHVETHAVEPAYLFLFLRQPSVSSLRALLRPDLTSESVYVIDGDGLGGVGGVRVALPPRLAATVSATDKNLLQLLDVLGGPLFRSTAAHAGMAV
jgi:type VI secretion system ImpM family protein